MRIDPDFKREQFQRLKQLADQGKLTPEPRKGFTAAQRRKVHAAYEGRCAACDKLTGLSFEVDHILPRALLGKHEPANWQLLCKPCHDKKTAVDRPRIDKCERQLKMDEPREPTTIQSPGFDKRFIRSVNGTTRARPPVGNQGLSGSSSIENATAPKEVCPADAEPSRSGGSE